MRLLNMHIIAFGCFTNERLAFSESGAQFHVIYGPNEAGKSTAMRALTGFLYGIPAKTPDAFLHDMKNLRVAATLEQADGRRSTFVRRKGSSGTLLDTEGKPIPDSQLSEFLGGVSKEVFDAMFGLDHATLRRGGLELLEGKGDLAENLFQAGTGITGLRGALAALEKEADALFTPRSSKMLVNRAMEDYKQAHGICRDKAVTPKLWNDLQEALRKNQEDQNGLKARLKELSERKVLLDRLKLALPHVTLRNRFLDLLATMGPVTELPNSASGEREQAARSLRDATGRKKESEDKLIALRAESAQLDVPRELLTHAQHIETVHQQLVKYRDAVRDLPERRAERRQSANEARTILSEVKPGLPVEEAETLRLSIVQRTRIRTLAGEHGRLQERLRSISDRTESARAELEKKNEALEETDAPKDASELGRAFERARRQGDLEAPLETETVNLFTAEKQAGVQLERLTLWAGTLEQLETLPVPAPETVDRFDMELDALSSEQKLLDARQEGNRQRKARVDEGIRTLQIGQAVPTEQDLQQARERREQNWQLVRGVWLEGARDTGQEIGVGADRSLAQAYEKSVADADSIADRLRREADRVAGLAGLLADSGGCERETVDLEKELSGLTMRRESLQRQWNEVWVVTGITPLSPREMLGWLKRQAALLAVANDLDQRRDSVRQLNERIKGHTEELDQALQALGEAASGATETFSRTLQRVQSVLQRLKDAAQQRADLAKEVDRLATELANATRQRKQAQDDVDAWQRDWQRALASASLSVDTCADEATATLGKLDELFKKLDDSLKLRTRVEQMEQYISLFDADVGELVGRLAPGSREWTPEQAATRLQSMLTKAQQDAVRRHSLERQVKEEQEASDRADDDSMKAEQQLNELMAKAHCSDLADLEEGERRSANARDLRSQIDTEERTLTGITAGATLDAFIADVTAMNPDQIPYEIDEIDRELQSIDDQRSRLDQQIGSERAALEAMDGSDEVLIAAAEAQSALARVRAGTERYLRLKLASGILRRHIELYREQNQDPIITRAGKIFPRLTCDSFARLKTDFDDKARPILLGVRSSGEEVDITGMSDGTRDQLFLALRLASMERQLVSSEPLPFVVDDVLVNFDDSRAEATLVQLAELTRHTQVLFFTHHTRLVELAKKVLPENLLQVHTLGTIQPSEPPAPASAKSSAR